MKLMLSRNDKLITVTKMPETTPMKFLNGDEVVLHEDNLAYFLSDRDIQKFKDGIDFIFKVSAQKVTYLLESFRSKPELLKLDAVKLEDAIQEENEKQLKMLESEKQLREDLNVTDATMKYAAE